MSPQARLKFQLLLSSLIGLELWLTGESELPATADDDLARLQARLLLYSGILREEHGKCDDFVAASDRGGDSLNPAERRGDGKSTG